MNIKNIPLVFIILFLISSLASSKPFKIIAVSDPTEVTHQLKSGDFIIGLTDNAGGIINQLILPGIGNIMGVEAQSYGRAGQTAIRDRSHHGWYNPTQAGYNETLGTMCEITQSLGKLIVEPHGCSLWHGDGQYDFVEWENIGPDPYKNDNGHGDVDGLDEENLIVTNNGVIYEKQEAEVFSEFDYYGTYEDYLGKNEITTPCIRHYLETRFIRPAGHCLSQFRTGTPCWDPKALKANLATHAPKGNFPGSDIDMNNLVTEWHLRHDRKLWDPPYLFTRSENGSWSTQKITEKSVRGTSETAFILAESSDENSGKALAIYRPLTDINTNSIIGVNEKTGEIVYKDSRIAQPAQGVHIDVAPQRTPKLSKYGFNGQFEGMINRVRLQADVYETFRSEYFILYGTPKEIMTAITALDKMLFK
jgi:hypothetical protein